MNRFLEKLAGFTYRQLLLVSVVLLFSARGMAADWVYVVSDGDNLWNLSKKYLGSSAAWSKVQKFNQLPDPNWIKPGTKIRIPMAWIVSNGVPASIRALQGAVHVVRQDGVADMLQLGGILRLGDRVSTGPSASVSIEFADNSIVTLESNSELSLDHLTAYGETGMVDSRMRLLKGRLETKVTPMSGPGSRFEIHTASAISAVRGTTYRMDVSAERHSSSVEVTGGAVDVSSAAVTGNEMVQRGFGTVVAEGEPPIPPRSLLPAPSFHPLPDKLDRISWSVAWDAVNGAQAYKLQLSERPGFETIRWYTLSTDHQARLPDLPDGKYYLRARAIDELGLEGLDRVLAVVLDAHPQPPVSVFPADNSVLLEQAPTLSWSRSLEAQTYRVQLAQDPGFSKIILDRSELRDSEIFDNRMAQLGTWYWRVASRAEDGEQGPFGAVRQFTVKAIPATPQTAVVENDSEMTVSWRSGAPGETYRVQIAKDSNFRRVLVDKHLSESSLTVDYTTGPDRYLRVQALDKDGDSSAWGGVQKIPSLPDESWKWALGSYLLVLLIAL